MDLNFTERPIRAVGPVGTTSRGKDLEFRVFGES